MIKSITIELEDKVRANVEKIVDENEKLRAETLTLRNNFCSGADNLTELRAENEKLWRALARFHKKNKQLTAEARALLDTNRKMADKLTLLKNAETMNSRLFQDWLDDRVTVIIK